MSDPIYVGLMSGTSLDGISAAVVRFTERDQRTDFELLAFRASSYTREQRDRMLAAMTGVSTAEYSSRQPERSNMPSSGWLLVVSRWRWMKARQSFGAIVFSVA